MSEKEPSQTKVTKNPELREKFKGLYKRYEKGEVKTLKDVAIGMRVSLKTVKNTLRRLRWESSLKPIEKEAKEELARKYEAFAIREKDAYRAIFSSPIPEVDLWIKRRLNDLRPKTRSTYLDYAGRCWKFIVDKYGLYDPTTWTMSEVEAFIYSDHVRGMKASSQNRVRTAINRLMDWLGKREIKFRKLKEEETEVVYMSPQTKRTFFIACKKDYPKEGMIPFTMGVIAQKTGTRIGTHEGRDPAKPELDRGFLGIRIGAIDLSKKPVEIVLRDKFGYTWTKLLDDEGEQYLREYLKWREEHKPEWKDNPFLFGNTTVTKARDWLNKIREKYNLYEVDRWGNKVWIHWHMFRDNFANECLLAMAGELKEGEEPDMDKGVLACCQLGGWETPDTFVKKYIARETLNTIKRLSFRRVQGKISIGV